MLSSNRACVASVMQMRLTANLFGELGQLWGLVNGKVGFVVDTLYDKDHVPTAANKKVMPYLVVMFLPDYVGPVWIEGHPKIVPIRPVKRPGDCRCCSRVMLPLQVAEATTIHSLQGMTISAGCEEKDEHGQPLCGAECNDETHRGRCAVRRLVADLGDPKLESSPSFRNAALVAISRVRGKLDLAFSAAVTRERLAVCGRGGAAEDLRAAMARFREQAAHREQEFKAVEEQYEALVAWAVQKARVRGVQQMPWEDDVHLTSSMSNGRRDEVRDEAVPMAYWFDRPFVLIVVLCFVQRHCLCNITGATEAGYYSESGRTSPANVNSQNMTTTTSPYFAQEQVCSGLVYRLC